MPTATLTDCVDLSRYRTLKAGKEVPLPTEQPLRYEMTVSAERWDGRWMIIEISTDGPECDPAPALGAADGGRGRGAPGGRRVRAVRSRRRGRRGVGRTAPARRGS
jgi:hypothetical protein